MTKHDASTLEDALALAIEALDKIKKSSSIEVTFRTSTETLIVIKNLLQGAVRARTGENADELG